MNEYKFENLVVGKEESFECVITDDKMKTFLELTGDNNPMHADKEFAIAHGMKDRLVYGMLTISLISTLAGVYLPGKYCVIQEVLTKFLHPVYIGDILTVKGIVQELNDTVKQVEIKIEIWNQDSIKVVRGILKVGFTE